jgi:hypothetical protein
MQMIATHQLLLMAVDHSAGAAPGDKREKR